LYTAYSSDLFGSGIITSIEKHQSVVQAANQRHSYGAGGYRCDYDQLIKFYRKVN